MYDWVLVKLSQSQMPLSATSHKPVGLDYKSLFLKRFQNLSSVLT